MRGNYVLGEASDEDGEDAEKVCASVRTGVLLTILILSYACPHPQEPDDVVTPDDAAFLDDNHSQGDDDYSHLYAPGKCMNVIGYDPETGDEEICGDACGPNDQLCHYCLTEGHRMTGLL